MKLNKSIFNMVYSGGLAFIKPDKVHKLPSQLNIEITTKCNLNCISCYRKYEPGQPSDMSFNEFKEIILKIKPTLICFVGFGEPMLHPDFFKFVAFASSMGISVSVTTNGTLIRKYISEICETGLYTLTVSLDAPNESLYKKIRKNAFYNEIIDGLEQILMKAQDTPALVFHYVIMGDNYNQLADFIRFSVNYRPSLIYFQPIEIYSESDRSSLVGEMTKELLYKSLIMAKQVASEKNMFTNLDFWVRDFEYIWLKYRGSDIKPISPRPCVRPWISSYISISGDVIPCCGISTKPKYIVGNIFQENFETIWNSSKYIRFRQNIKKGVKSYSACSKCVPLTIYDKYRNFSKREMI